MAFEFINSSSVESTGASSLVVNKPTNTSNGDIMFALVVNNYGTLTNTLSGWTRITTPDLSEYYQLFYKVASSEGASYTWTHSSGSRLVSIVMVTYRGGFVGSNPIDVVSTYSNVAGATIRASSISVAKANSPIIIFGIAYGTSSITFTKPSVPTTDWVENFDAGATSSDFWKTVCSMVWGSSGATGDIDITASVSVGTKGAVAIALNPPSNIKSYNTNLKANIKSINTNLIANVKSLNTNV